MTYAQMIKKEEEPANSPDVASATTNQVATTKSATEDHQASKKIVKDTAVKTQRQG